MAISDVQISTIPLNDDKLCEADGSLLSQSSYPDLITYISGLYNDDPTADYFAQSDSTTTYNYTETGSLTNVDGVLSGFSGSNYATIGTFNPGSSSWEIVLKVKFATFNDWGCAFSGYNGKYIQITVAKRSSSYYFGLDAGDGSNWYFSDLFSSSNVSTNTDYYIKIAFTGTQYIMSLSTDGETWTQEASQNVSSTIPSCTCNLGTDRNHSNSFTGSSIDLNGCYIKINDTITWQGATQSSITPEQAWQNEVTATGVCGKYVYDNVNNTVRIPKYGNKLYTTSDSTTSNVYYYLTVKE